jgi:hypothetical protein
VPFPGGKFVLLPFVFAFSSLGCSLPHRADIAALVHHGNVSCMIPRGDAVLYRVVDRCPVFSQRPIAGPWTLELVANGERSARPTEAVDIENRLCVRPTVVVDVRSVGRSQLIIDSAETQRFYELGKRFAKPIETRTRITLQGRTLAEDAPKAFVLAQYGEESVETFVQKNFRPCATSLPEPHSKFLRGDNQIGM